jgi:hypothetical protein
MLSSFVQAVKPVVSAAAIVSAHTIFVNFFIVLTMVRDNNRVYLPAVAAALVVT